jgi:hypothetical protein
MSRGFKLFHVASPSVAEAILRDGFVDSEGSYVNDEVLRGVFLSNRPLDCNEGVRASDGVALAVTFDSIALDELDEHELVEDGKTYREWCIPVDVIRRHATVQTARFDDKVVAMPNSIDAEIERLRAVQFLD